MIPKVIHYCWFGNNPKSEIINRCIDSWKLFCSDYQIIEWNESNFDVLQNEYCAAAYKDKKYAFVSDYARLKIVHEYGGIYLDTDVLLHNTLDELLKYDCWLASDDVRYVATGLGFGAVANNRIILSLLTAYNAYPYPSGTNVTRDTLILEGVLPEWKKSNASAEYGNTLIIGVSDYGKYAKHLYTFTWGSQKEILERNEIILKNLSQEKARLHKRLLWKFKCFCRNPRFVSFFDKRRGSSIERIYTFLAYDLLDCGLMYYIKRLFKNND